jgi:hypothetical protein
MQQDHWHRAGAPALMGASGAAWADQDRGDHDRQDRDRQCDLHGAVNDGKTDNGDTFDNEGGLSNLAGRGVSPPRQ